MKIKNLSISQLFIYTVWNFSSWLSTFYFFQFFVYILIIWVSAVYLHFDFVLFCFIFLWFFFALVFFFYFNFQVKPVLVYVLFGRRKEAWHISVACVDIYPTPPTNPSDMPKIELLCTFVTSTPSPLMWFVADVPSVSKTRKACECIKSSIVATPWTRQVHLLWLTLLNDEEPRKTNRREKNKQFTKQSINFFTKYSCI